jgi:OOP family OmpA-OmpF porin
MKKILLTPILCMMLSSGAFAQSEPGYLTDSSGNVVKSGFGLCWNTSATKVPNVDCGDVLVVEQPKVVAQLPVPQVIPVERSIRDIEAVGIVLNSSLLFKFDSAQLSKAGEEIINKEVVAVNPYSVEIIGHTDQLGTQKYNLKLSQARAESVKNFLVSKGIKEDSIKAVGMGETKLLCEEKNPKKSSDCSTKNRRVEIMTTTFNK